MGEPWVVDYSSEQFDIEDVHQKLTEHGVVVVENVIPSDDCDTYIGQINEWMERFKGKPPANVHSIIHQYNVPHIEPAWRLRLQTQRLFSLLWGTNKLMTSTDGIAVSRPPEDRGKGAEFSTPVPTVGWHYDQSKYRQGLHAYQGAVYLEHAEADDWCFAVSLKSNHYHHEFFEQFEPAEYDHRKLSEAEVEWLTEKGCTLTRIAVPKGGVVLWDSRTVHAGAPPVSGRKHPERWRYVVFVCQTPAIWATPEDLTVKREAYTEMKCSRHWASNGVSNFQMGHRSHDLKERPEILKSEAVQLLAGVKEYDFNDGQPNGPPVPTWI